jgi:hypothetical protein
MIAAALPESGTPYIVIALSGFAVGILGHLAGSRLLVGVGVALVCLGALLLPLALNLTEDDPPEIERLR